MNTSTRLAAFTAGLAVVFGAAVGVGHAVGPVGTAAEPAHGVEHSPAAVTQEEPTGLSVSEQGYTLQLETSTLPVGRASPFAFVIDGPGGHVTDYSPTHDRDLHLIVVRRDTTGFQHLHPERDPAGRWSLPLTLDAAGAYKVFADFAPDGRSEALTLAADIAAAGTYAPQPLPPVSTTSTVNGYTVSMTGELLAGQESRLVLSIRRDGEPVTDLQPYLAAYGHLVALRAGDLAYLHVHPDGAPGDGRTAAGPEITFYADVPTAGDYRLYLDFQHDGVVRTAVFTARATGEGSGHAS